MLKGDSAKALEFLKVFYPEGPWCLSAINPDKKGMETRTFYPATEVEGLEWIERNNGYRNCYFHVNPVMGELNKKAEREDIAMVCYLHVDVDPQNSTDQIPLAQQQDEILARFDEKLPKGVPPPSFLIFSGGGYQGFWKLAEPIQINGDLARAEDAKRYNQQLETLFGGDNCHNIDRLMRLPYTVNIPDAKKKAKGREPTVATVVIRKPERVYEITRFVQATVVQTKHDLRTSGTQNVVDISGNVKRITDMVELDEWQVPDRVKVIIAQGHHPDPAEVAKKTSKNGKPPSRSEWLFDVCCNLVRCEVPDATIYSLITDPNWGISESVVELKGGQAHRYAIKQIVSAKEYAIDPVLAEFNEKYCVVGHVGGKVLICWKDESEILPGVEEYYFKTFEEFQKEHENRLVQVGTDKDGKPVFKEAGKWWRKHTKRRQVAKLVFRPDREEVEGALNLWTGFTVESIPGDKHESYLMHLRDNICLGNLEHYEYLLNWMARAVQFPAEQGHVAVVLQGPPGTGKGTAVQWFRKLFGRHSLHISNPTHLVGQFNSHLRDCCVLYADEAFFAGDKKHLSVLKTLVTEDTIPIERKGVDIQICPNYIHLIMSSNDDHVIKSSLQERRYFVLKVGDGKMQDAGYFNTIKQDMDGGGLENLLYFLRTRDIKDFQVRDVPKTAALDEQTNLSLSPIEAWWYGCLMDGVTLPNEGEWATPVPKEDLYNAFIKFMDKGYRGSYREMTPISFGILLGKLVPNLTTVKVMMDRIGHVDPINGMMHTVKRRTPCYTLPDLKTARDNWDKFKRRSETWPDLGLS